MPNQTVKVVSDNGFFAYADKDELNKWRSDKSVPLVDVVESFHVYQSDNKGASGLEHIASKAELRNNFGVDDVTSVIEQILQSGKDHTLSRDSHKGKQNGSGIAASRQGGQASR
ncbi:Shwachman-Bodian-diamond syndrome protein-domain-containing protein [Chytriomyces sp. MP71]|nr:Shwachman-Bodian-diamond syndrome protein-domain-containing protein [Chytriomyces sp. MP71]